MNPSQQNFSDKLAYQMKESKTTSSILANYFGIKAPSVDGWLKTGRIGKDKLPKLAEFFGTSIEYWIVDCEPTSEKPKMTIHSSHVAVWNKPEDLEPSEDRVWIDQWDYSFSAGDGYIQWEIRQKQALPFNKEFFKTKGSKPENTKLLTVKGDSMEPYLFSGDLMMIDVTKTDIKDGLIYAVVFEGDPLVKKIFKESGGVLTLHSLNTSKYRDKTVTPSENTDFRVVGEVIYRSG